MSENGTRSNLLKALRDAKVAIGFKVERDSTNPHFKNRYASLEAVAEKVEPILLEKGLVLVQTTDVGGEGLPVLVTTLYHAASGEALTGRYPLTGKNDPQGLASAMTYARRYTMMAFLGLTPADDDGNAASGHADNGDKKKAAKKPKAAAPEAAPEQRRDILVAWSAYFEASGIGKNITDAEQRRSLALAALNDYTIAAHKQHWPGSERTGARPPLTQHEAMLLIKELRADKDAKALFVPWLQTWKADLDGEGA